MKHFLIAIALTSSLSIVAQNTTDNSLKGQFETLKRNANRYQDFKVVKETALDSYWKSVRDSIQKERLEIERLRGDLATHQGRVVQLESAVAQLQQELAERENQITTMDVWGWEVNKETFRTLAAVLVGLCLLLMLIFAGRYTKANRAAAIARRDQQTAEERLEQHRKAARENETKLRRDLQTEINKVEELKAKLGMK